ncbi:DNA-binding response regulator, OmpR family, containings REC and winged-helix [Nostoc flagelliforme CCNUN1]|uniref:Circadian input-output histidine kinase CikA n=1 Tax=Nostoc flagelliforme CCNUN1 TaxID=2038116 RepID=A0A2K8SGC9_9NOSO|nr:PAS domain S-box protein [Nostoc flagelliforme]AUB34512.1 DNA-binding response regulator, OmpR family, containings REC and winged-helix [Nostoc flagelliforme CCNUN1]
MCLSPNNTPAVTEVDVLITEALASRPARQPNLAAENRSLHILSQQLIDDPQSTLKTLVEIAIDLCRADTAGVSLLETDSNGESRFRWVAIAGALEFLEQTTTPSNFSPCGTTLQSRQPQLYAHPERYFTYLYHPQFPIVEGLLIPLSVNNQPLGTLWILSHHEARQFDAEDHRLMTSLAGFTASALQSIHQAHQTALEAVRHEQATRAELHYSQMQFEALVANVPGMVYRYLPRTDSPHRFTFVNSGSHELLELEPETILQDANSFVKLIYSEDLASFETSVAQAIENLLPWCWEGRIVTPSGKLKWIQGSSRAVQTAEGYVWDGLLIDLTSHKRAEAALRQSEEFNRQILESSDDCIKVLDLSGLILYMSPGGQAALNISDVRPLLNSSWIEFWQGADRQAVLNAIGCAKAGKISTFQGCLPTQTGEPKWWDNKISPIKGVDGQVERLLCISRDITARRQAEAALRESEERLRRAIAIETVGVIFFNTNGSITESNDAFLKMSGYSREDIEQGLVGWDKMTPPEWMPHSLRAMEEFKATGSTTPYEKEYIRKDGSRWWGLFSAKRLNEEDGVEFIIDITNRKQTQAEREQLLAREQHYANQLQGLTTAALAINSALSVQEVLQVITEQAASIISTHQSVASMTIDQNWAQAINAIHLSDKYAQWRDYDQKSDGSGIYACVCNLNQSMRMTQAELESHPRWRGFGNEAKNHPPMRGWLAAPLIGRDGHNIGLIQLSDKYEGDFTEADEAILVQLAQMASIAVENARLYEAEQQARLAAEASREEAEAANRVKDEFLAVLSHELRSPLNPILGWSNLLQSHKLDEAKTMQALAAIQRNAKLQSDLIEDLLDVSRILRGKLSLNVAPVDLAATIQAGMETVRLAAQAKSISVQTVLEPNVGKVLGDSTRLQQVIWNLLSNAIKFTPEAGQVNIRLEQLGSVAQISVSDTGKGIHADFIPYVFDYFRQADGTTTRKFGGLGLGLAIARHLVELHGGTVEAESPGIGQGATFTIRLPLMSTQPATNQDSKLFAPFLDLTGINVLVVDDDTDTRDLTAFVLEQYGAIVTAVSSATEAFLVLTQSKPDVLLSDIGMPDVDGYMLIEYVRSLFAQGDQIKAIALTAYAGEMNQQQALKAGFHRHISKPIEPMMLVQAISSLVRST